MKERIIKGGFALLARQVVSLPVNAIGVALASRFLLPADYGALAILTPIIALSLMLTDLGTSQALVRSNNQASSKLLCQVQFLKLLCGALAILVLIILSGWLIGIFGLSQNLIWIFPACGLIGWLQSQRAFQAVALQRRIDWQKLAKIEMVEIVVYNIVLIVVAYYSRSPWCFIVALGFRMAGGAIILKVVSRPAAESNEVTTESVSSLLRFGVPMQSATLLSVLMNSANPIVVGRSMGIMAVGYINWSNYIVSLPQLPLNPLPHFLFSILSERRRRGKDDQTTIADISYFGAFLMAVFSFLLIISLDVLVHYVLGSQWLEAIPAVSILLLTNVVIVPSLIITAQLNANGHSPVSLMISGCGVLLLWTAIVTAAHFHGGLVGYAVGVLCATLITYVIQCSVASKRLGICLKWNPNFRFISYMLLGLALIKVLGKYLLTVPGIGGEMMRIAVAMILFSVAVYSFERRTLKRVYGAVRSLVS